MNASTNGAGMTAALAAFVADTRLTDLPAPTRHAGKRALVNILGCCIGGARHDIVEKTTRSLQPLAGPGVAGLLGRGERADILNATLLNAMASGAYSFDDTHAQASLHPSGAVATALLAVAEQQPMTGEEFLLAFVLGIDVASRISKTISVAPGTGNAGWSQTGITAGIGAAAAAARAFGLDERGVTSAIGIAALQAAGFRGAHGSMAVTLIFGHAAQGGLRAALLAREGLQGPAAPLEGAHGFFSLYSDCPHLPYLTEALGATFEVESLASKAFPCGAALHPAVDAAMTWQRNHGAPAESIEQVHLRAHPLALSLGFRRHPAGPSEAKVSLYHWVAAALALGRASIAEGAQPAIDDPRVARLRDAIHATEDVSLGIEAASLRIELRCGEQHVVDIEHVRGSTAFPMSDADLEEKFRDQVSCTLPPARTARLLSACWGIEQLGDVAEIARLAHG